ncbi:MAG: peptide deformylase [Candidatus Sumerlaeales bacterium]|nr:peptide deformylase [Candidatus Sumerlaeales bacterium]
MSVRDILKYPNFILRQVSKPADPSSSETIQVVNDLVDTLNAQTGVGVSAPQIGASLQIIVIDATRARRPVPNHGPLVLINPEILSREGKISFREGCMSVPDFVAHITRASIIRVNALTPDGKSICFETEGFEAVIIQHEIDHLYGKLFIDRVQTARDLKMRH